MPKRVFVVEDNHACETILRRVIRSIDPEAIVDWEESAEDAIALLARNCINGQEYDLIIADIFLSGKLTGIELWQACTELFPRTPVLVTSGMPVDRFFEALGRETITPPYLCKPFYAGECRQVLEGLLATTDAPIKVAV